MLKHVDKCMDDGASPLYIACQKGHLDIVEKLLYNVNTDVNKCIECGRSPLYIACQNGHVNIVKIILKKGADIYKSIYDGTVPLHAACYYNHIDVVEEMLKDQIPKFDIDVGDNKKWTSLYFACEKGYTNIARILLDHHADPHRCNEKGHSPFMVAQQKDFKEILDIIQSSR
jgi:serine/threonine-protein phosphatase 6 regulatory ankyrin repeat subunit B